MDETDEVIDKGVWGEARIVASSTVSTADLSATPVAKTLTLIFNGKLAVEVLPADTQPLAVAGVNVAVGYPAPECRLVRFDTDVRGYVFKSEGCRVVVSICAAGSVQTIDYDVDAEIDEPLERVISGGSPGGASATYSAVVSLAVEKFADGASARVEIDSFDVSASEAT